MPALALDRSHPLPLWAQLEAELRRRIDAGDFPDGAFPTDLELTETYDVSRHTVRDAVKRLSHVGLLVRERGRGTVIKQAEFEQSLGTLYSLFQSIESTGTVQTSEVLELGVVKAPLAANQLGIGEDSDLVLLARLRLAGGEPLAIDRAWLPRSFAEPLLGVDWSHTALYAELAAIDAPVPNQGWERLSPLVPTPADRAMLGLKRSEAAFHLERLGSRDGVPVEWRTTTIRGDRYRFVAEWSAGAPSQLRPSPS